MFRSVYFIGYLLNFFYHYKNKYNNNNIITYSQQYNFVIYLKLQILSRNLFKLQSAADLRNEQLGNSKSCHKQLFSSILNNAVSKNYCTANVLYFCYTLVKHNRYRACPRNKNNINFTLLPELLLSGAAQHLDLKALNICTERRQHNLY